MIPVRNQIGSSGATLDPTPVYRPGVSRSTPITSPDDVLLAAASAQPDFDRAMSLVGMAGTCGVGLLVEASIHFECGDYRQALSILDDLRVPGFDADVKFMLACCLIESGIREHGFSMLSECIGEIDGPALDIARRYVLDEPVIETVRCRDDDPEWDRLVSSFYRPTYEKNPGRPWTLSQDS